MLSSTSLALPEAWLTCSASKLFLSPRRSQKITSIQLSYKLSYHRHTFVAKETTVMVKVFKYILGVHRTVLCHAKRKVLISITP